MCNIIFLEFFKFSRHNYVKVQNFQNLTSYSNWVWNLDPIWCITHDIIRKLQEKSDFTRFGALKHPATGDFLWAQSRFSSKLDLLFQMLYDLWESDDLFFHINLYRYELNNKKEWNGDQTVIQSRDHKNIGNKSESLWRRFKFNSKH